MSKINENTRHLKTGNSWADHGSSAHNSYSRVRWYWSNTKFKKYFRAIFERKNDNKINSKWESIIGYTTPVNKKISCFNYEGLNLNVEDFELQRDLVQFELIFRKFIESMETLTRIRFNEVSGKILPIKRTYKNNLNKKKHNILNNFKVSKND